MPELVILIAIAQQREYDINKYPVKMRSNKLPRGGMIDPEKERETIIRIVQYNWLTLHSSS